MLFVIGGAYQGKLDYIKDRFVLNESDIFCCSEDSEPDFSKRCIYHYEKYVLYAMRSGKIPVTSFAPDQIVIMDDLNCGVVPLDAENRAYREAAGRTGCAVSRNADEVVRIFCGLPKTLKARTRVWLIRHGKTRASEEGCYCGSTDIPLSENGRAGIMEKKRITNYPDPAGKTVYTSGLARTRQTAEILFPGAGMIEEPAFNEMDFGSFEMRRYVNDLENDPGFIIWSGENNETNICPGGESSSLMKERVLDAFKRVVTKGGDSIIVSHGGPIAAVFSEYNPESGLNYYEILPKWGEGYFMEFDSGKLVKCEIIR